jgi:hypothetical protein
LIGRRIVSSETESESNRLLLVRVRFGSDWCLETQFGLGSVRIDFWKSCSGSVRFDFIFRKAVRVRFGSAAFWKSGSSSVRFDLVFSKSVRNRFGSISLDMLDDFDNIVHHFFNKFDHDNWLVVHYYTNTCIYYPTNMEDSDAFDWLLQYDSHLSVPCNHVRYLSCFRPFVSNRVEFFYLID